MGLFGRKNQKNKDKQTNTKKGSAKKQQNTGKRKGKSVSTANSAADAIPYIQVYENGIIEVDHHRFSKSYKLPEINFATLNEKKQYDVAEQYADFISQFTADTEVEMTLYNRSVDPDEFRDSVLIATKGDQYNYLRDEMNDILIDHMKHGKNNLTTDKIITVTVDAADIQFADERFAQIDRTVSDAISQISDGMRCDPMPLIDRLDILNSIYNPKEFRSLKETGMIDGHESEAFSLKNCERQGITTKDVIAPSGFNFKSNVIEMEDSLVRSYSITNYPSWIKATLLTEFSKIGTNALISVHYKPMDPADAISLVKRQSVNINAKLIKKQTRARNYDPSLGNQDLQQDSKEAATLRENLTKDNTKLFCVTFVVTIIGDTEDEMKKYESELKMIATKNLVTLKRMDMQQEPAFSTALPIGNNRLLLDRLMTSYSIASLIPFNVREVKQEGGIYYGCNAISKNMVLYNRTKDEINANGVILGIPGGGKSFAAKRELLNVLLGTEDEVYVIDPQREYVPIADKFDFASVVKISSGSKVHLNPFDLNMKNITEDEGDPVKVKTDFITTLVEIMIGGRWGLSPIQESLVNRACRDIYDPYTEHLKLTGKNSDPKYAPTLKDFWNNLCNMPDADAANMALALERYVYGTVDVFSHHSNIDVNNRFVVYDIKDIGNGLNELGLQITLDHIWQKMIENGQKGKRTWLYIDEMHLLMQTERSASYISSIWKLARKWNGIPTAMTQNVEDMLKTENSRTLLNNSPFLLLLGQTDINREQLSNIFNISPIEQRYIARPKPGTGLLHTPDGIIPVEDDFPKDTTLYKIMTTRPDERIY